MSQKWKSTKDLIAMTAEMKDVIAASPFIALTSIAEDGEPHLVVVGKAKEIKDDSHVVFGVYKMDVTRRNLAQTDYLQAVAVAGKVGYRFTGKAVAQGDELVFSIQQADPLL